MRKLVYESPSARPQKEAKSFIYVAIILCTVTLCAMSNFALFGYAFARGEGGNPVGGPVYAILWILNFPFTFLTSDLSGGNATIFTIMILDGFFWGCVFAGVYWLARRIWAKRAAR